MSSKVHKIEKAKLLGSLGTLLLQAPILDATLQKIIMRLSELDSEWSSETVCAYIRMVALSERAQLINLFIHGGSTAPLTLSRPCARHLHSQRAKQHRQSIATKVQLPRSALNDAIRQFPHCPSSGHVFGNFYQCSSVWNEHTLASHGGVQRCTTCVKKGSLPNF